MKTIFLLKNPAMKYAWGSPSAIPELLGIDNPAGEPWAELWMGAHPKAPSEILVDGRWEGLAEFIRNHPTKVLGTDAADRFHATLPFLFKVLAAARPLSIQAHPTREQARQGFAEENRMGIPLDAPNRNFKDDNHKPECICALTPFTGLNGFRSPDDILENVAILGIPSLDRKLAPLRRGSEAEGMRTAFQRLMATEAAETASLLSEAVAAARRCRNPDPAFDWMVRLHDAYPADIGVLSPILMNLVTLEPGRAMFLPAGAPHAYLDGVGIEIMANSDNVLRGGLTPKHLDVDRLMSVLRFEPTAVDILTPRPVSPVESVYPTPAEEFRLSVLQPKPEQGESILPGGTVQVLLCTRGRCTISDPRSGQAQEMGKGASVLVTASAPAVGIRGDATLYRAAVPPAGALP